MNPTNLIISIIVILILGLILKEDTLSQSVKIILCAIVSLVAYCALNIYNTEGFVVKKERKGGKGKKEKKQLQKQGLSKTLDSSTTSGLSQAEITNLITSTNK